MQPCHVGALAFEGKPKWYPYDGIVWCFSSKVLLIFICHLEYHSYSFHDTQKTHHLLEDQAG